jgi:hypothetical protein
MGFHWNGDPPPAKRRGCGFWAAIFVLLLISGWILVQLVTTTKTR